MGLRRGRHAPLSEQMSQIGKEKAGRRRRASLDSVLNSCICESVKHLCGTPGKTGEGGAGGRRGRGRGWRCWGVTLLSHQSNWFIFLVFGGAWWQHEREQAVRNRGVGGGILLFFLLGGLHSGPAA